VKIKFGIYIIGLFLLLVSCDQNRVFESYKTLDQSGWHKDSLLVFPVEVKLTGPSHNLYINLRNSGDYQFSNIWLFINIKSPDGKVLTDTVEFQLADPSGKWQGNGIGDLFDNQFDYKEGVFFPTPGIYEFTIQQGMRSENLKGIQDVGLRIEKRY